METKARSNKKSLIWLLVLNGKKEASNSELEASLNGCASLLLNYSEFHYVFSILHNKDTKKAIHLHAFIQLYEPKTLKQMLDLIQELCKIDRLQISLEPSNNEILGVQYLTHKNQPEKEQYDFREIKYNNYEELQNRFGLAYISKEERRIELLFNSPTITDLLKNFTIEEAKKVLPIWKQIQEEQRYDKHGLFETLNKTRRQYEDLYELFNRLLNTLDNSLTSREKRLIDLDKWRDVLNSFDLL